MVIPVKAVAPLLLKTITIIIFIRIISGLLDNHSAEWAAFIRALEYARELNVTNALLYTDSKLIEDAMLKDNVKNIKFKPYLDQVKILEPSFDLLFVKWIPREQNKEANHHAKQTLYQYIKNKD